MQKIKEILYIFLQYIKKGFSILKLIRIRRKYKDYCIFVALSGLGDICYSFAFLDQLKSEKKQKILVITRKYSLDMIKSYSAVDDIIVIKDNDFESFNLLRKLNYIKVYEYGKNTGIYSCDQWENYTPDIIDLTGNYISFQKHIVYSLNASATITHPHPELCDLQKFKIDNYDKTVIINTKSNFLKDESDYIGVFENIVGILNSKGYTVYENCRDLTTCIKGTVPLNCTVQELYWIVSKCKVFISVRSGIMDYIIGNSGRYIALYPHLWNDYFRKAYSLYAWETDSEIFEYYYDEKSEIIDKLLELVD